jgi:hypothetical protein
MKTVTSLFEDLMQHDLEYGYEKSTHNDTPTLKFKSDNDVQKFLKYNKKYSFLHKDKSGIHLKRD